ncbi:MAG: efflux RND transporter periplasmic adaptor subunit [Planctomycetes bacterium]|nr:efflux RND transporter periplasmic adaptor subunit [Planctomycetota bacterium]
MSKPGIINIIVIPLLIILESALTGLNREANASFPQKAAIPVEVAHVRKKDINTYLLINCTIEAEKQVDIMTKTSGQVKEILVEEGQKVAEGQALAKLDETESLLALKDAKIRCENAKMIYERSQGTYEDKITSKEQLDESRLQYETSMVDYERKNLEYTYNTITSPIAGIVVGRVIEVGNVVQKNQKVFAVANFNPLLARIHVPEKDLSKLKEGQPAIITIESLPGLQFNGVVKMISPVVDPESGTIKVTIEIEYTEGSPLRPGMFASVYTITEQHANALIIPKKALLFESEGAEVFVVKNFAILSLSEQEAKKFVVGDYVKLSFGFDLNPSAVSSGSNCSAEGLKSRPPHAGRKDDPVAQPTDHEAEKCVTGIVSEKSASGGPGGITIELLEGSDGIAEATGSRIDIEKVGANGRSPLQVQNDALQLETRAHKAKVKLGFSEGNEVEVISGLNEDDVIVIVGHEDLGSGAAVTVVSGTEAPSPVVAKE